MDRATTGCTTICHLPKHALPVTARYEALGTMHSRVFTASPHANDAMDTASSNAVERLGECCMGNICELSFEPS